MNTPYVLVLFYSRYGATEKMAQTIARGVEQIESNGQRVEARLRTVPSVSANTEASEPKVPEAGAVYCSERFAPPGLIMGSPTRFGNMAAALKHFIDGTGSLWSSGALIDKPFCYLHLNLVAPRWAREHSAKHGFPVTPPWHDLLRHPLLRGRA